MATPTEKRMTDPKKLIERGQIPCGPMAVSVDGVCRRRLRDSMDALLDRITQETHPEGRDPEDDDLEDDYKKMQEEERKREAEMDAAAKEETIEEKKARLIEEGRMKAEVKKEVSKYEEKLMGNSKMLQDPSGKIKKR
jgi:hypothetical protein